ncbi:MAG: DedA family protein [Dehalococcoidia bacterium]
MDALPRLAESLFHAIENAPQVFALLAIFLWVFLEEAGLPLVPTADMILIFAGWRVSQGQINPVALLMVAVVATVLGSGLLYLIARRGGHPFLVRYARLLHLDSGRLERAERWVQRHRGPALIAGRMIPGLKTVVSIAAGLFAVEARPFALYTAGAATIWAVSSLTIGRTFGPQIAHVVGSMLHNRTVLTGMAAAAAPVALLYLYRRFHRAG